MEDVKILNSTLLILFILKILENRLGLNRIVL